MPHKSGIDPTKRYPNLKHDGYFTPRSPYLNEKRLEMQRRWMKAQRA